MGHKIVTRTCTRAGKGTHTHRRLPTLELQVEGMMEILTVFPSLPPLGSPKLLYAITDNL